MNLPKMFRKNPFRTNYFSIFSSKVQNLTVFSFIYMIRIRFSRPGELNQNGLGPNSIRGFSTSLKWKVSWRKKGLWNLVGEKILRERGALPEEEFEVIRERRRLCMKKKFLSNWLREEGKDKEERIMEVDKETKDGDF